MSFLAEGNKLVEEMPAESRCRVSRAGSAEGRTCNITWRSCFDMVSKVLVEGLLCAECCQETQVSRKELQRSKKRSQESASIQSLFPSQKDDCVFITQGSYLIQDPWGKVFFFSLLLIRTFKSKLTISSQRGTFDWEFCCKIICLF